MGLKKEQREVVSHFIVDNVAKHPNDIVNIPQNIFL